MILQLTEDTTRIGIRIKSLPYGAHAADTECVQLVILPGQKDAGTCCHTGGSPWFLRGCWPGKLIGVDIANPPAPDFPAICINAFERNADGQLIYILPERWKQLPYGRYTGEVRYQPKASTPINLLPWVKLGRFEGTPDYLPPWVKEHNHCCPFPEQTPPPPPVFHEHCCILTSFDIDYGPRCSAHIIDQVGLEFSLSTCEEDI